MSKGSRREPNPRNRAAAFAAIAGAFLALYLTRPDGAQAIHWWPMAFCTPVAFLPFVSLRPRRLIRPFFAAVLLWGVALLVVGEPSVGILLAPGPKCGLRVVSLNCAGGTLAAAREAFAGEADVVLLQEVGSRDESVRAGADAGYPYVSWSVDDAVFSRRPIADAAKAIDFAAGTVAFDGQKLRVVALRLLPPVFRLDLWSPDCWRAYAEDVALRRARMEAILMEAGAGGPCLVGGDFNATNPRIVTDARRDLEEAGRTAGRGWRGTGTNDFPAVWTDQIWASPDVRWRQAFVEKTQSSDHRMVVADFDLTPSAGP